MKPQAKTNIIAGMLASLSLLAACGGGGGGGGGASTGSNPAPLPQQFGTLSVGLTDAPACGFDQVNVSVSKVRVHTSASAGELDAGWTDITLSPARKINLLNLSNGVLDKLGQTSLAVGHYTQVRLVLAANETINPMANSVVPTGGTERALDVPSGTQSGIKLIHDFDVAANAAVDLTLDFDACKSVVSRNNSSYLLKPVVNVVQMAASGSIDGVVDPTAANSHPVVTAQQNGVVIKTTVPDSAGKFKLSPISAGTYDVVVTADNRTNSIISGVPVKAGASVAVSTAASPLPMPVSTVASFSGTVLPAVAEAEVKVSQNIPGGPTVVITYKLASYVNGAYSMTLPSAAPLVGQYGSGGLPLVQLANLAAQGKYGVQVSAAGYQSQLAGIDVSLFNVVKDFTLVP
jgi:hypothetical protein